MGFILTQASPPKRKMNTNLHSRLTDKQWCSGNDTIKKFEGSSARTVHLPRKIIRRKLVTKRCCKSTTQSRYQKRKIKAGIMRVREEMAEISETQSRIREDQRRVREKLEEIQREREQLWKETEVISKQSASIRSSLNLILQISKARAPQGSA